MDVEESRQPKDTTCTEYSTTIKISLIICLILLVAFGVNNLTFYPKAIRPLPLSDFEQAVKLISDLHSKTPSLYGLKYRAMVCTLVRNDPHLVEFLLRHLISGFSHFVIYDNNRIEAGFDMNITAILAPFVAAGVVTHVPWLQNTTELAQSDKTNNKRQECFWKYGRDADWLTILDTDEAFYYEKENVSFHTLDSLLLDMERQNMCGCSILWTMMYGEAKVLMPNKTLFEAYPRQCGHERQGKVLARPSVTRFYIPHGLDCLSKNLTKQTWQWTDKRKIGLVHYFSKSMEEFLVKSDQSFPPYIRRPIDSYFLGPLCYMSTFNYAESYRSLFLTAYEQLKQLHPIRAVPLHSSPGLNIKEMPDYSLFMHLKYRCAKRHEFDNDQYLFLHPDAKKAVLSRKLVDGFYHFMANFTSGVKGCWKTNNYSFCE